MRRGFWVVLGLVGVAPIGALAQEVRERPAEQARVPEEVSNEVLQQQINELWEGFRFLQQQVAELREEIRGRPGAPGVAGAGRVGTAPGAGGAGQAGTATAEDEAGLIIAELPEGQGGSAAGSMAGPSEREDRGRMGSQSGRSEQERRGAGIGGGGQGGGGQAQADVPPNADIYVGTVRSVTGDRLILEERTGRIYELGVDEQTRVIGQDGVPTSLRALEEGTPVRAVATESGAQDQIRTLYILVPAPVPER